MRCSRFNKRRLAVTAALAVAVTAVFWEFLFPYCFPMRTEELVPFAPARLFFDCDGAMAHLARGGDYRFQFPVTSAELPGHLIAVTLAAEDRNFFDHDGVDPGAVLRAAWQLLRHGRIVSGASTVTMQLVAMADGNRERTLWRKIRQMGRARNLELHTDKRAILEAYYNLLPYGGKVHGIEAAAQYYFGRPAAELNFAEAVLLAGVPQRPGRLRPDRYPEAARRRQEIVLGMLVRQGMLTEVGVAAVLQMPLRYRDFSQPRWPRAADPQFFRLVEARHPNRRRYDTTLDPELQQLGRATLRSGLAPFEHVRDGALVILENSTGKVRALIGTLDFQEPRHGQVNAALAPRSPGSLLKPFIYGEAVNGGVIVGDTLLEDAPLLLADYRPGNFDGVFRGWVPAGEALADSLNTPAIRLLRELGPERIIGQFGRFGLPVARLDPAEVGLSLALGGAEFDLLSLANAFSALANGGASRPYRLLEDEKTVPSVPVWHPGAAAMTLAMLRLRPLPGAAGLDAAWKTGTSNNSRDAWCIAVTPEWTVAVWCGNKDGSAAPELVGGTLAAPIAGRLLGALCRNRPPSEWPGQHRFAVASLCAASGLAPTQFCAASRPGTVVAGIPLRSCPLCRSRSVPGRAIRPVRIISPAGGTYHAAGSGVVRLQLRSDPVTAHWYLDGRYLGLRTAGDFLDLAPGNHRLQVWGGTGYGTGEVLFHVTR